MPCCMGCSEINKINRHLICRLLPHTVILIKGALLYWMFKFSNEMSRVVLDGPCDDDYDDP